MEIILRPPGALTPHPSNPRRHSAEQKEQLFASVSRFGWTVPVIIDEDQVILAGHGRWEMAVENGFETIPTITINDLTEEEKRAYLIADNKLSENANWDIPQLLSELEFLASHAIEADTLGFSDADILGYQSTIDDVGFVDPEYTPPRRFSQIESMTEPTQLQEGSDPTGGPSLEYAATLVPFSVMLPVDDRERVYAVLNQIRGDDRTMAEALMVVIDSFDSGSCVEDHGDGE